MGTSHIECHSGSHTYGRMRRRDPTMIVYFPNVGKNGAISVESAKKWIIPHDIRCSGKNTNVTNDIPSAQSPRTRNL